MRGPNFTETHPALEMSSSWCSYGKGQGIAMLGNRERAQFHVQHVRYFILQHSGGPRYSSSHTAAMWKEKK